jgi:RimJ/RimL family protein N-acetyltransferase
MAESTVIETERLRIVTFSAEHLTSRYVGWLNDPDVVRFSQQRLRKHTLESCRDYWRSFEGSPNYFWAIVARDPELGHIGNMNAYVDTADQVADVGILIGERSAARKGHATEAWTAVCAYLFAKGIRKVTCGTLAVNIPMMDLARRVGMKEDGRRVRQVLLNGSEVDVVYWALFRDDWHGSQGRR